MSVGGIPGSPFGHSSRRRATLSSNWIQLTPVRDLVFLVPLPKTPLNSSMYVSWPFSVTLADTEIYQHGIAVAARDGSNRDVVIKLLGKRSDSPDISDEYQLLCLLNTELARADQCNATVPVLKFIDYEDWKFAVMPMCCGSAAYPLLTSEECLNLASQLLHALAYLHEKNIAHRDISPDNLVMNYHGHLPDLFFWGQGDDGFGVPIPIEPVPGFRSTFPVKYSLIDFGYSVYFPPDAPRSERLISERRGRPTRAPEVDSDQLYDPFAADVYQAAQMIFSWFGWRILDEVPKLLDLMHDMTSANPADRISMDSAASRMKTLYDELPPREQLTNISTQYRSQLTSSWLKPCQKVEGTPPSFLLLQ
ncbi:unnamed protein product [Cyclocybe aegerita]|uniref:Protein kinase domain-containing protein n=1 Tax=Cyclocybe aegerita TaxID=1973307 RepID=A0A8S0W1C0_CYCAE|nr:unnamed protein product [Cyclocybe aegerita]